MYTISIPVADLRKRPVHLLPKDFAHHDLRESQLLYGEKVSIQKQEGDWLYVHALEQNAYPGWIHKSEINDNQYKPNLVVNTLFCEHNGKTLSYGTYLSGQPSPNFRAIPEKPNLEQLCQEARLFLGAPYLWGGCSAPLPNTVASVDCSGLIHLLYRAQGIQLPRNAHEQYLFGTEADLAPGNPIYLSKDGKRYNHVILPIDEKSCIESPETGKRVRLLNWGKEAYIENNKIYVQGREPASYGIVKFEHPNHLRQ